MICETLTQYFAITEFNNCFFIRSPSLFFNEYLREAKRSAINFFTQERNVICSQTQFWTTLRMSRPLFVSSYLQVTWWNFRPMKRKKNLQTSCKRLPLLSLSPCRLCYLKFKRVSIIAIDLMYFRSVYALFVTNANKYKQIKLGTVGPVYP